MRYAIFLFACTAAAFCADAELESAPRRPEITEIDGKISRVNTELRNNRIKVANLTERLESLEKSATNAVARNRARLEKSIAAVREQKTFYETALKQQEAAEEALTAQKREMWVAYQNGQRTRGEATRELPRVKVAKRTERVSWSSVAVGVLVASLMPEYTPAYIGLSRRERSVLNGDDTLENLQESVHRQKRHGKWYDDLYFGF